MLTITAQPMDEEVKESDKKEEYNNKGGRKGNGQVLESF